MKSIYEDIGKGYIQQGEQVNPEQKLTKSVSLRFSQEQQKSEGNDS